MANYYGAFRTNDFRVTEEGKYSDLIKGLSGEDLYFEEKKDKEGRPLHFIGGCGGISYAPSLTAEDKRLKPYLDRGETLYDEDNKPIDFSHRHYVEQAYNKDGKLIADAMDDNDFDKFLYGIQALLPEGEAFTFTEVGHEKPRYVGGWAVVVTKDKIEWVNLSSWTEDTTKALLG